MNAGKVAEADVEMQHIVRLYNTNIDGTKRVCYALTGIRGIGKRISKMVVRRSGISENKRAGELTEEEINKIQEVIADPIQFGIPRYFLNHMKDVEDGKDVHLVGIKLDANYRMAVEKGKKMKEVRMLRLAAGLKVRGQRTKSNGRKGKRKIHKKK